MEIDGKKYTVCFRDALEAAKEEILRAAPGDMFWGGAPTDQPWECSLTGRNPGAACGVAEGAQSTLLRGVWDGERFKEQVAHEQGTMSAGTKVLGLHVYSDETVLSRSGAVSAYPLRMRVANTNPNGTIERWVTVAYIPKVAGKILEARAGQEVRSKLLQRVLPEERAVMCLKATGGLYPCTPCKVGRDESCFAEDAMALARDVEATVGAQVSNATMGRFWGSQARRAGVELAHRLNSVVPALAAWAGLGSGPRMLYRLPGFDRLHVRSYPLAFVFLLSRCDSV